MSSCVDASVEGFQLLKSIKGCSPRGGSAICELPGNRFIAFGGVDRNQTHFDDVIYGRLDDTGRFFARNQQTSGDVPNPRSGHAMVAYGPFLLLSGGIDFGEEAVYNDLYILDTVSWSWYYVGESGHEVIGRNSHSLAILTHNGQSVLVIYGGASPEHGPLGDTLYAYLPPLETIDVNVIAVHWHQIPSNNPSPSPREMHSTSSIQNMMIISGGRDDSGNILAETWVLRVCLESVDDTGPRISAVWAQNEALALPKPACAHTSFLQQANASGSSSGEGRVLSYIALGGFSYDGLAGYVHRVLLRMGMEDLEIINADERWTTTKLSSSVALRFGHCITPISSSFANALAEDVKLRPLLSSKAIQTLSAGFSSSSADIISTTTSWGGGRAALVFGGVNAEEDFNDLWMII